MQILIVHPNSLPPDVWERATKLGRMQGRRLIIEPANLDHAWRKSMKPSPVDMAKFPGIVMRSDEEQAALLEICGPCRRNVKGRCSLCRSCGGGIPVIDWVKLSTHRCPDKKW